MGPRAVEDRRVQRVARARRRQNLCNERERGADVGFRGGTATLLPGVLDAGTGAEQVAVAPGVVDARDGWPELRLADGSEFLLIALDEFDDEIFKTRNNPRLIALLETRAAQTATVSLDEVKRRLQL